MLSFWACLASLALPYAPIDMRLAWMAPGISAQIQLTSRASQLASFTRFMPSDWGICNSIRSFSYNVAFIAHAATTETEKNRTWRSLAPTRGPSVYSTGTVCVSATAMIWFAIAAIRTAFMYGKRPVATPAARLEHGLVARQECVCTHGLLGRFFAGARLAVGSLLAALAMVERWHIVVCGKESLRMAAEMAGQHGILYVCRAVEVMRYRDHVHRHAWLGSKRQD